MTSKSLSCGLLSSFTLDQLPGVLRDRLESTGVNCRWFVGPFNQYPQLILTPDSELIATNPQVVFLAVAIEDLLSNLPSPWSQAEARQQEADRRIRDFMSLAKCLTERLPSARIFVHDFLPLAPQPHAILSVKSRLGLQHLALQANLALAKLASECPNLSVVHLEDVFASMPQNAVMDPRYFYLAKMRFGRNAMENLAVFYSRVIRALLGLRKKCIVLDLDNTLWGGIVGEDGIEKLILSDDGPGKAFQDFQRILLEYYETGTLLAICSKNDEALALSVLRDHPSMILRPQYFAAIRINWEDKAANLQAIAAELNLGVDSLVFLDDSEFERSQVRRMVPSITVPDLPPDWSDYPAFAASLPFFDALSTTEDDRRRGQMYAEDRQRRGLVQGAASLDEFLRDLAITVTVRRADQMLVPRVAQLTQRTNQFNLTTRRYTEGELASLLQQESWRVFGVQSRDRIGDTGVVGAALVQLDHSRTTARLDTFLLSCRILGRGIEAAFLAGICSDLRADGFATMEAEFIPTDRNGLAKEFLPKLGFNFGGGMWTRALDDGGPLCPKWINLQLSHERT